MTLLHQLAEKVHIGTDYVAYGGHRIAISEDTLARVLTAMGYDVSTEDSQRAALQTLDEAPWRRTLPPVVVLHQEQDAHLPVNIPDGTSVSVRITHRDTGLTHELAQLDHWVDPRTIDGQLIGRATFHIPAGLDLGWYTATASTVEGESTADVVVTPACADWNRGDGPLPKGQRWGGQAQLYACTSRTSWGIGDFADLGLLAEQFAADGADFLLINPVHAANMEPQITASPYSPTSRRFVDPQYLRPQLTPEYQNLTEAARARVDGLAEAATELNSAEQIDRDAVWALKEQALWEIFTNGMTRARAADLDEFTREHGQALKDFAGWSAGARGEDFHRWLQMCCREQLRAAQDRAVAAGMDIGIIHDLAVGVDVRSADAQLLGNVLVTDAHVGAPPDMFNQLGQDWGQPPWHPVELVEQSYKPLWDVLTSSIDDGGGLRIDHILGFFRLWWIPKDSAPQDGAYVYYDHNAMIGLALLAAHQAGAVLIGEDLGTFEDWVQDHLVSRGLLGTTIYFFENDGGHPRPTENYRVQALTSLTTHDLPPSAGYLEGVHIHLREQLGLLTTSVEEESAGLGAQRDGIRHRAQEHGYLNDETDTESLVVAAHKDLAAAPSRLLGVSVVDVVGQRQVQNQPGTSWQYPNWCIPLGNDHGRVSLEELPQQPAYRAIVDVFKN